MMMTIGDWARKRFFSSLRRRTPLPPAPHAPAHYAWQRTPAFFTGFFHQTDGRQAAQRSG